MTGPADGPGRAAAWPEIAATSRVVWPLVLWRATSEHPVLGAVRGRGLSHGAALRSLARQVQRRTSRVESPGGGSPDQGIEHPPVVVEERGRNRNHDRRATRVASVTESREATGPRRDRGREGAS